MKGRLKLFNTTMLTVASLTLASCGVSNNGQAFTYQRLAINNVQDAGQLIHVDRTKSGGFSAMWASDDCQKFVFISDYSQVAEHELAEQPVQRSMWYQTHNTFDKNGRLTDLIVTNSGSLQALDGNQLSGAAESMFWNENGYVVSFDDTGDLLLYPSDQAFDQIFQLTPRVYKKQTSYGADNDGLETIAKLHDGTIVSIWEKRRTQTDTANVNLIFDDGTQYASEIQAVSNPKDAAVLSDGTLVILEKDWLRKKGSRVRLSILANHGKSILKTLGIIPTEVMFDNTSIEYDNFEGMASCTYNGEERLYIVSDDNGDWPKRHFEDKGIPRQKTLLLSFSVEQLLQRKYSIQQ